MSAEKSSSAGITKMSSHLFVGPLIHTKSNGELLVVHRAGILVQNGKIISVTENPKPNEVTADFVTLLSAGQFLIPGFIDCHIHAPQLPNIGTGYDKGLLDWLEMYTFPLERKYSDEKFAERIFDAVVKRTLTVGTTTACYFASLYAKASLILGQKAACYGQRAFIGKLNMNRPRDDGYYESTENSVTNTKLFIEEVNSIGSPLIKPIITPRFALSCDLELLKELGKLANELDIHVQTHVSENLDEIEAVKELFPGIETYTEVYEAAGLLTNKTVLAHGVHLKDNELDIIKSKKSAVIHCPSSNTCLRSGLCDVRRLMNHGIKIGLGTDVAGGTSVCILDAMRSALQVSNSLSILNPSYEPLKYTDVFHFATLGGASSLMIEDQVGNFEVGKEFDALVIDMNIPTGPLDGLIDFTLEDKLQRLIYSGDDRNIVEVYVKGCRVK
ncbi:guanine deaminase isoform X2 [Venturia canescens]|uniref:guanine deaminase isoform X2 n=1 Tax=Venturia canescens TaxID=32260 RepID=UPI001C9D531E|nr:guanine deaminase isoform X2 [Venturia canescens]